MARRFSQPVVPGQEEVRIGFASRIRSLPFAGLVLLGVMASGLAAPWPGLMRFLLAVAVVVWIPGAIACRLLGVSTPTPFVGLPLQFFTGVSLVSLVTWAFVAAGLGFGAYGAALQWALAAGFAAAWVWGALRGEGFPPARRRSAWRHAALLVVLAGLAAARPVAFDAERDALDHVGYIRQITTTRELAPAGVLADPVPFTAPAPRDPRKGTFHDVLAVVCEQSSLEPLDAWAMLPVVLFPLAFFAFLGFCRAFVPNAWALAACAALFASSYGGIGYDYAATVGYGQNLAVVWYWLLVPLSLAAGAGGARRVATAAVLAAGGTFVHFGVAWHALLLGATLLLLGPALPRAEREAGGRCAVAMIAAALVAALWRYAWLGGGHANEIHTHPQGLLYVAGGWFVVSPIEVLREHGLLFLGALAMTPVLAALARGSAGARRELSFAALPLVVCFVPVVTTPLVHAGSYLVSRALLNAPALPMIVTAVAGAVSWGRRRGVLARATAAAVLSVWSILFLVPTARAVARSLAVEVRGGAVRPPDDALVRYARRLPPGSVVLSDPKTSYELSAVTNHRFVAVNGQHGNPYDPHALDRLRAVRDVLSPYVVSKETLEACDRYGVDFVVVNGGARSSAAEFLSVWDSAVFPIVVEKLAAISGRFRAVHRTPAFVVFLYDPAGEGETVWGAPASPLRYTTGADVAPCRIAAPDGAFDVVALGVSAATIVPGETVSVTVGYETNDRAPFGLPYLLHLRLDHASTANAADYPGAKYVRRARERSGGERLRYTMSHRPMLGLYDVDMWPIGATFYEQFEVVVPPTLKPGEYSVALSVERDSILPNFTLGDLLFNRDRLSGRVCGELTVTTRRTLE